MELEDFGIEEGDVKAVIEDYKKRNRKKLNEDYEGNCEHCGKEALLSKGYGKKFACEKCYYEHEQDKTEWIPITQEGQHICRVDSLTGEQCKCGARK